MTCPAPPRPPVTPSHDLERQRVSRGRIDLPVTSI
ncbi:hypothetical protein E2C01_100341 [Portunus trituberculatus]|uniref:Uncharacterized protein n=1 Tax=Portunus trituberculatus TaxID=210409 RepID=A0A5B7K7T1_PORTR|nr:hypothetical protein [Portunus trituberculatus]